MPRRVGRQHAGDQRLELGRPRHRAGRGQRPACGSTGRPRDGAAPRPRPLGLRASRSVACAACVDRPADRGLAALAAAAVVLLTACSGADEDDTAGRQLQRSSAPARRPAPARAPSRAARAPPRPTRSSARRRPAPRGRALSRPPSTRRPRRPSRACCSRPPTGSDAIEPAGRDRRSDWGVLAAGPGPSRRRRSPRTSTSAPPGAVHAGLRRDERHQLQSDLRPSAASAPDRGPAAPSS